MIRRSQLLALGVSRAQANQMIRNGRLRRTPHRGVYRVAGTPDSPDSAAWIAVLGARAVLSYLSAAQWWELPVASDGRLHVTRYERQKFATHRGIRVHRTLLVPGAVTTRLGLRVTTRVETLLDCLGWLPVGSARNLLDRSFQQSWLDRRDIERRLDEQSGRWGNKQLVRLLRESRPGAEAESERRLQRLFDQAGIRGWVGNYPIVVSGRRFRLDVAFVEQRVDVEADGWAYHRAKERRDADMVRDNLLTQAGWRVLRFGWEDIVDRPDYVIGMIRSVLVTRSVM